LARRAQGSDALKIRSFATKSANAVNWDSATKEFSTQAAMGLPTAIALVNGRCKRHTILIDVAFGQSGFGHL
jgi:hypothetical protein